MSIYYFKNKQHPALRVESVDMVRYNCNKKTSKSSNCKKSKYTRKTKSCLNKRDRKKKYYNKK